MNKRKSEAVDRIMELAAEKGWKIDREAAGKVVSWAGVDKALGIIERRPLCLTTDAWPAHVNYDEYLKSSHWLMVRMAALAAADYRCALCNSGQRLDVHHKTYERLWQELPADLTVLCRKCHSKYHDVKPTRREQNEVTSDK